MRRPEVLQRTVPRCSTRFQAPTFVGVAFALLFSVVVQAPSARSSGMNGDRVVALTNAARATHGEHLLRVDPLLTAAARERAEELLSHEQFSHTRPDGAPFASVVREYRYPYAVVGENLGLHFTDERSIIHAWTMSPGHARNLFNPVASDIGVGVATGTFHGVPTTIVVQLIALPQDTTRATLRTSLSALRFA